jgi:hypothetical protein
MPRLSRPLRKAKACHRHTLGATALPGREALVSAPVAEKVLHCMVAQQPAVVIVR